MSKYSLIDVSYIDHMGDDLSVVNAARVSFAKKSERFSEKDEKLIKYLAKHKHMSPFGHCMLKVKVKAPILVARQLMRHEYLRINEVSRRYVDHGLEFYFPSWRERPSNGMKQGSGSDLKNKLEADNLYRNLISEIEEVYHKLLALNIAPEQARAILPTSLMTEWIWTGSLDAFAKMYNMRADFHTQMETREVAFKIDEIARKCFPISWVELTKEE